MAYEWSSFESMIAEAKEMQAGGRYINGRVFHSLVNRIEELNRLILDLYACNDVMASGLPKIATPDGFFSLWNDASCRAKLLGAKSWTEMERDPTSTLGTAIPAKDSIDPGLRDFLASDASDDMED